MSDTTIVIYQGFPDGTLKLSDNGYMYISQYRRIHWVIAEDSNVGSIEKVDEKDAAPPLFIWGPKRERDGWTGRVMHSPGVSDYYITWKEKGTGIRRTYDPKIAVKPSLNIWLLFIIVALILGLATIGIRRLFFAKK
jgi:hypothetical protein